MRNEKFRENFVYLLLNDCKIASTFESMQMKFMLKLFFEGFIVFLQFGNQ